MNFIMTSIKLNTDLYTKFKEMGLHKKMSFQDFVNYCLKKYITESTFTKEVDDYLASINNKSNKLPKKLSKKYSIDLTKPI